VINLVQIKLAKMKKNILFCLCLFIMNTSYKAQSTEKKPKAISSTGTKNGFHAGIQFGTLGAGAHFVYALNDRVHFRLSGAYIPLNYKNSFEEEKNVITDNELQVKLSTVGLKCDLMPSKNLEGFRFSIGLFYNASKYQIHRIYTYNDGSVKEDLGTLTIKAIYPKVNPYLGMVFGKYKPTRKVNVFLEMGVLYIGKPTIDFTGSGRVEPTAVQGPIVQENLKGYNWMPNINLHLNYKIK
jgi:hypothetical protein